MTQGIIASLAELIAIKRLTQRSRHLPDNLQRRTGNHRSALKGRGMDFAEVRNYQAGDEIRHMEWRMTARTGRPHIKIYEEERERPLIILVDFSPSMYFGTQLAFKSCVAARLAATIAWTASAQGDRIGGLLNGATAHHELTPRSREAGVLPLLSALSRYTHPTPWSRTHEAKRSLSDALLRLRHVTKPGSTLVLISDFYTLDETCEQHLSRLKQHNTLLAYHITDALEIAPPAAPNAYALTNGESTLTLDTRKKSSQEAYQQYCDTTQNNLIKQMNRLQIQLTHVTARTNLPLLVYQTYPRRSYA